MRILPLGSPSLVLVCAAVLLAGCGGAPPEAREPEAGEVTASQYPDCDPAWYCRVHSPYVYCADGIGMWAFSTPDGGYCIERNVCAGHGGPTVCPYD